MQCSSTTRFSCMTSGSSFRALAISEVVLASSFRASIIAKRVRFARAEKTCSTLHLRNRPF